MIPLSIERTLSSQPVLSGHHAIVIADRLMTFHQLNNFLSFYPDCLDTLSINYFDAISKKIKQFIT